MIDYKELIKKDNSEKIDTFEVLYEITPLTFNTKFLYNKKLNKIQNFYILHKYFDYSINNIEEFTGLSQIIISKIINKYNLDYIKEDWKNYINRKKLIKKNKKLLDLIEEKKSLQEMGEILEIKPSKVSNKIHTLSEHNIVFYKIYRKYRDQELSIVSDKRKKVLEKKARQEKNIEKIILESIKKQEIYPIIMNKINTKVIGKLLIKMYYLAKENKISFEDFDKYFEGYYDLKIKNYSKPLEIGDLELRNYCLNLYNKYYSKND